MAESTVVTSENILTLRRRLVDKLCKDNLFAITVIGFAMRKGKIRYNDLMTEEEAKLLTVSN